MITRALPFLLALLVAAPAQAVIRGQVDRDPNGLRRSVVWVESSRGGLCSGVIIAPDQVLTAAHCVSPRATYRVVAVNRSFRPVGIRAVAAAMHPAFVPGTTPDTQPGVDLAILKLETPLRGDFVPLDPAGGAAGRGEIVSLAGFGTISEHRRRTDRVLRSAQLVVLGPMQLQNRVLVVADRNRLALTDGAGACLGDSGGPIVRRGPGGAQLVGVVSFAAGAVGGSGRTACGGFTAVTPVAEHASWIRARSADLARLTPGDPITSPQATPYDWAVRN
ncbi:MAG TPA: trypsin-like serine protease [Beijerinckiaceae bacterium]|nr:trypsin-like serine protease [Beijerinckiaceae bacterium]